MTETQRVLVFFMSCVVVFHRTLPISDGAILNTVDCWPFQTPVLDRTVSSSTLPDCVEQFLVSGNNPHFEQKVIQVKEASAKLCSSLACEHLAFDRH